MAGASALRVSLGPPPLLRSPALQIRDVTPPLPLQKMRRVGTACAQPRRCICGDGIAPLLRRAVTGSLSRGGTRIRNTCICGARPSDCTCQNSSTNRDMPSPGTHPAARSFPCENHLLPDPRVGYVQPPGLRVRVCAPRFESSICSDVPFRSRRTPGHTPPPPPRLRFRRSYTLDDRLTARDPR
jgi:hypothetical protein